MENKKLPAFPITLREGERFKEVAAYDGMTKRELIATHVLPECIGLFSPESPSEAARMAVQYADALIAELEK